MPQWVVYLRIGCIIGTCLSGVIGMIARRRRGKSEIKEVVCDDAEFVKFGDTRGIPDRYLLIWGATSAILMLLEAVFARNIIGSLVTLMGLPFVMMTNLWMKQGEYYDYRFGYRKTADNLSYVWFFPVLFSVMGFALGIFLMCIEFIRGRL